MVIPKPLVGINMGNWVQVQQEIVSTDL
ncbi:hypothetical protein Pint_27419 [Pistacia integerrima]|uniref:Uncharacterized protein n=1 Tax=Pistacia integerrima TaxID=434235 RepID=A0ACC0YRR6_9ROSI|nr:hypothetical protein Pint_27419 [Pistacia integerrima]